MITISEDQEIILKYNYNIFGDLYQRNKLVEELLEYSTAIIKFANKGKLKKEISKEYADCIVVASQFKKLNLYRGNNSVFDVIRSLNLYNETGELEHLIQCVSKVDFNLVDLDLVQKTLNIKINKLKNGFS